MQPNSKWVSLYIYGLSPAEKSRNRKYYIERIELFFYIVKVYAINKYTYIYINIPNVYVRTYIS